MGGGFITIDDDRICFIDCGQKHCVCKTRNIKIMTRKEEYDKLLESGMFWEFHPELTGDWNLDESEWNDIKESHERYRNSKKISKEFIEDSINYIFKNNPPIEDKKSVIKRGCIHSTDLVDVMHNCGDIKCPGCVNTNQMLINELEKQAEESKIFSEIQTEINKQDIKWGIRNQHPASWFLILNEEIGEAAQEVNDAGHDTSQLDTLNYRTELIQSCAVLIQMIKNIKHY